MAACFRYIVNDVDAAIEFYTRHLGFKVEMHPAPGFAEISRGDMHIYLTRPSPGVGGGAKMPFGRGAKARRLEPDPPPCRAAGRNDCRAQIGRLSFPQRRHSGHGRQADPAGRPFGKLRGAVPGQHRCVSRARFGFESRPWLSGGARGARHHRHGKMRGRNRSPPLTRALSARARSFCRRCSTR